MTRREKSIVSSLSVNVSMVPSVVGSGKTPSRFAAVMVREVGFEPTNPYGTGASGLRFQDPLSTWVSLTWLGNTGRPIRADSRKPPGPPPHAPSPNQGPNWLSHHGIQTIRIMFNSAPAQTRTET